MQKILIVSPKAISSQNFEGAQGRIFDIAKFLSKKAWYNFYSPLFTQRNYKWIYFLAFSDLAFLIMNRLLRPVLARHVIVVVI